MDYVVFETGGKQYKVKLGDVLEIDRLNVEGNSVTFGNVLLRVVNDEVRIGRPYISDTNVEAKILSNEKGDKIRVARFTAKSRHRRVVGFRPSLTKIQIEKISTSTNTKKVSDKPKKKSAKV